VIVGPDGKNPKQELLSDQGDLGRPDDIIIDKYGSILVADDWAGAVHLISHNK
jgi:glucose/arabinose dehydrogenase